MTYYEHTPEQVEQIATDLFRQAVIKNVAMSDMISIGIIFLCRVLLECPVDRRTEISTHMQKVLARMLQRHINLVN